jgi:hypothetical protein
MPVKDLASYITTSRANIIGLVRVFFKHLKSRKHSPELRRLAVDFINKALNAANYSNQSVAPSVIEYALELEQYGLYNTAIRSAITTSPGPTLETILRSIRRKYAQNPEKPIEWDWW